MSSPLNPTRQKILQAAWDLLEQDEPGKTRLGDIAKRAGVSRQAVYLHFASRAELLTETARYIGDVKGVEARLEPSRKAETGKERLREYCIFWTNWLPEIKGVSAALNAMEHSDEDAKTAWADRMAGLHHGCEAAVSALIRDGDLREDLTREQAANSFWTLMNVYNWRQLTQTCGWSQEQYGEWLIDSAEKLLIKAD